jgi:hypothetical protein
MLQCLVYKIPFPKIKIDVTYTKEIEKIIKSPKSKNSYGYYEILIKILKVNSPLISSPVNYICIKSLSLSIFSAHLKYSEIKPVFKKGDKNN